MIIHSFPFFLQIRVDLCFSRKFENSRRVTLTSRLLIWMHFKNAIHFQFLNFNLSSFGSEKNKDYFFRDYVHMFQILKYFGNQKWFNPTEKSYRV